MDVIIVTAPWDRFKPLLNELCDEVVRQGINCQVMNYSEPKAVQLLLRQGIENGMIRIPKIFIIMNNDKIIEVKYQVNKDLVPNIKEEVLKVIHALQFK